MPGVSISVTSSSVDAGQRTSSQRDVALGERRRARRRARRRPRLKRERLVAAVAQHGAAPRSSCPCGTTTRCRVHSPASVGASRSPTSALSSVDLPALTRPAIATCSGPSSRARGSPWPVASAGTSRSSSGATSTSSGDRRGPVPCAHAPRMASTLREPRRAVEPARRSSALARPGSSGVLGRARFAASVRSRVLLAARRAAVNSSRSSRWMLADDGCAIALPTSNWTSSRNWRTWPGLSGGARAPCACGRRRGPCPAEQAAPIPSSTGLVGSSAPAAAGRNWPDHPEHHHATLGTADAVSPLPRGSASCRSGRCRALLALPQRR